MGCLLLALCLAYSQLALAETRLYFNGSNLPYAEYKPWDVSRNGAIEIHFKTAQKDALLLYQDDGEGMDWIDVFLVQGKARLRLRLGNCLNREKTTLNGSFSDSKWHWLKVKRNFTRTTIAIDGVEADSIMCKKTPESPVKPKSSKTSLYLGGIPMVTRPQGHWANPTIYLEALKDAFTGCIARVRFSNSNNKVRRIRYRKSSGTTGNCAGACEINKCINGGKCIDMLVSMRCDCNGTGHVGRYCDRKAGLYGNTSNAMVFRRVIKHSAAGHSVLQAVVMLICGLMLMFTSDIKVL